MLGTGTRQKVIVQSKNKKIDNLYCTLYCYGLSRATSVVYASVAALIQYGESKVNSN